MAECEKLRAYHDQTHAPHFDAQLLTTVDAIEQARTFLTMVATRRQD